MQLLPTHIIGRHLTPIAGRPMTERCCLCGCRPGLVFGISRKTGIPASFMDDEYLSDSPEICVYCAACISAKDGLRKTSFLATPSKLLKLKRSELWQHLMNPPSDEPFAFAITFSGKKHIAFRAKVNLPGQQPYYVETDRGRVALWPQKRRLLIITIQRWYDFGFTKTDIRLGSTNLKRIQAYGVEAFKRDNELISRYRGSALLELLVHCLNKTTQKEE